MFPQPKGCPLFSHPWQAAQAVPVPGGHCVVMERGVFAFLQPYHPGVPVLQPTGREKFT